MKPAAAGAWREEERAPPTRRGARGGEEEDQGEPDDAEDVARKNAAADAPVRRHVVVWHMKYGCSAAREAYRNKRQACAIGKKSDRYSKSNKMKATYQLAGLLRAKRKRRLAQTSANQKHIYF